MHKSSGDGQLVRPNRHAAVLDFSPFISPGLCSFRSHVRARGWGNAECCFCRIVPNLEHANLWLWPIHTAPAIGRELPRLRMPRSASERSRGALGRGKSTTSKGRLPYKAPVPLLASYSICDRRGRARTAQVTLPYRAHRPPGRAQLERLLKRHCGGQLRPRPG